MKRGHQETGGGGGGGYPAATPAPGDMAGAAMAAELEDDDDCGVDELLAALGYKVRSSDMPDVAQKLQQLEAAMASTAAAAASDDASLLSQITSDAVHYNPSDISAWLDSMLSELEAPPPPLPPPPVAAGGNRHQPSFDVSTAAAVAEPLGLGKSAALLRPASAYDFGAIPRPVAAGGARVVYGSDAQSEVIPSPRDPKRMRTSSSSSSCSWGGVAGGVALSTAEVVSSARSEAALPMVVVDTQEAGVRLVHALLACAEAVQQANLKAADALVKQISVLAASQGGPMRKVAGYFAEALALRIYRRSPLPHTQADSALDDALHLHFYESCPYLKFAHFTANQAILEAFAGCRRVHVIDFGMRQGMQWPALLQALALRPGGPPSFRLTGIGRPQPDHSDALHEVGWKLAMLAESVGVDFRYRGFVASSLADLEPRMLLEANGYKEGDEEEGEEAVAVNSVMELHRLLARPGAVEKVLGTVRAVRPRIVTVVEEEASHNEGAFLERFTGALHYYSSMFDSLESGGDGQVAEGEGEGEEQEQRQQRLHHRAMAEVYMGRQICNVVACEGPERTERHETLARWRGRMARAGFEAVHLGSNAFKQASMLLALYAGGDGFRVEEADGCLSLGWHTRPLIATSAWRVDASATAAVR